MDRDRWLDHVGRGFWFAVGFTPAFLIVLVLITLLVDQIQQRRVEFALRDPASVLRQTVPQVAPVIKPAPQVAHIAPADMSSGKQLDRDCSVLMLRYSENPDPAIKQQIISRCSK